MEPVGTLSIIGTPIGNLGDITLRALETLKQADAIACEDTRVSAKLFAKYAIEKPLLIYHAQSTTRAADRVMTLLAEGKRIALVTDAGMPGVSDPGIELVHDVRARLPEVRIEVIPGPSALTAAVSLAGLEASSFVFLGFLPNKKGRQTIFREIAEEKRTVIFYESTHRIEKALASLVQVLKPTQQIAVCRELTKIHEEAVIGTAAEVAEYFQKKPSALKGEFVVIVEAESSKGG